MHSFWKKRLPAMLLAVLMIVSTMPAAMALNVQARDITLVAADEGSVGRKIAKEINDAYYNEFGQDMYYVQFETVTDDTYGTLYHSSSEDRLRLNRDYYYGSGDHGGDYPLSDLYFVPEHRSGEYAVDYVAYGRNNTLEGTLVITGEDGSTSHKGTDFEYQVKAGEAAAIDAEDFANAYERKFRDDLLWVDFSTRDTLSASNGMVYYDYEGRDETAFDEYDLDDYDFYYYSRKDGDYPLDDLSFVAGRNTGTITLSYDACGRRGTVSGTVKFTITGKAPAPSAKGDIVYKVHPGEEVIFDSNDFYDFFEDHYDGSRNDSLRWVEFSTRETLSSKSTGYLCSNYESRDEEVFDETELEDLYFYYDDESYGDYALDDLSFVAGADMKKELRLNFTAHYSRKDVVEGTVVIVPVKGSSADGDIAYKVDPGKEVRFDRRDFYNYFEEVYEGDGTLRWVDFYTRTTLSKSEGYFYVDYDTEEEVRFDETDLRRSEFYYSSNRYGDYALDDLSFVAGNGFSKPITLSFTAYADNRDYVEGTVVISPAKNGTVSSQKIEYKAAPGKEVRFNPGDFYTFFQKESGSRSDLRWVEFSSQDVMNKSVGQLYDSYGRKNGSWFDVSDLPYHQFYYKSAAYGDYALANLSFVAGPSFSKPITLNFTAYADKNDYVKGTLVISPEEIKVPAAQADILYQTTYNTNVQINANDIARYMKKAYPGSELVSIRLDGVPAAGGLYYNYYGASKYGGPKTQMTGGNCKNFLFKFSPASTTEYAMTELTYVPSGFNYCASIPFTAYGTGSRTLRGSIFISINQKSVVSEVYGITPQGAAVMFPGAAISYAVTNASGFAPDSIRFLRLPDASVGTMYEQAGSTVKAGTETKYSYTSGKLVSQLRFAPAAGFTGSVEIPYVAYNQAGSAIASGKFSLGVVSKIKTFSDVPASIWCYKYVTELTDAKVIDGYKDGTFKPNRNVTYGQALKLIMLAAGYAPQAPISGGHIFSGYLAAAQRDKLVTGKVNLDAPITRLAVAQIAAKAMRLDVTGLSSVKPFTDTSDPYVQALNAAGIVEGYFNNGTSTYKPDNNLTRGHISAIVWRIEQAK